MIGIRQADNNVDTIKEPIEYILQEFKEYSILTVINLITVL